MEYIPYDRKFKTVVYERRLLDPVVNFLKAKGETKVEEYLNMTVDENSFKPFMLERAIRLNAENRHHVDEFVHLKQMSDRDIDVVTAIKLLTKYRYYGVFENEQLVSRACALLRMPEVWTIGDVYIYPSYRSRGCAKAATSAIIRDAVISGARALLSIVENNVPAIHVYRALGYKRSLKIPWVSFNP
ncbi:MAG: hypothetical protein DRJ49_06000 [Thermoprotei archaeon]|nr:MAG: hypothetical protein DRJ49_06000 [Thermoprotei archaeon]